MGPENLHVLGAAAAAGPWTTLGVTPGWKT